LNKAAVVAIPTSVAIVVIIGAILAISGQDTEPEATKPASTTVQIGALLPLTGDRANRGHEYSKAAHMAVDDFNAYLKTKNANWNIELVLEDTQTSPELALEKIQALHARGINLFFGPATSAELSSISSYVGSNNLLVISPSSTSPALAAPDNIFRLAPDDTKQGIIIAQMLAHSGKKIVIPIYRNDVWANGLYQSLKQPFEAMGGTIDKGVMYNAETNFSGEAEALSATLDSYRAKGYHNYQISILMLSFSEAARLLSEASLHENLGTVQWLGSSASVRDTAITDNETASKFVSNVNFLAPQFAPADNDIYKRISTAFDEEIGRLPNNYAYSSYDSMWLLGLAIEQTQSADTNAVADALSAVSAGYVGAIGAVSLNESGDLDSAEYEIFTVRDGEWAVYERYIKPDLTRTSKAALPGTVQIGVLFPATGDLSSYGQEMGVASRLAGEDFNAYLNEKNAGWNISLILEDTQSSPELALEKIRDFNAHGINLILGPETSAEIASIIDYAKSRNMVVISPSSTSPALSIPDHVFRLIQDDTKQGEVIAQLMRHNGKEILIPIYRDDIWGNALYVLSNNSFENLGGIADDGIQYRPNSTLVAEAAAPSSIVDSYRTAGYENDQIGILVISFAESADLMREAILYDNLKSVQWFGSSASAYNADITSNNAASSFISQVNFVAPQFAPSWSQVYQSVLEELTESLDRPPANYAYSAYDSVWLLGLALEQAQSTDADELVGVIPNVGSAHTGAVGVINLNENGDLAASDYDLVTVRDGSWAVFGRYVADTDSIVIEQ